MSIITPLVCYYSALDPSFQTYVQTIPNINPESSSIGELVLNNIPLYNDLYEEIGILKWDTTDVTVSDKAYVNRTYTAYFNNYGSVSFPLAFTIIPDTPYFTPGSLFKMPILYCSGNDIYNLKGTVELYIYGNDVKTRSITIKFDSV